MQLTIKIALDNAAFEDAPGVEVGRILTGVIEMLESEGLPTAGETKSLQDYNGNTVGHVTLTGRRNPE
jgi:hypothetical protein